MTPTHFRFAPEIHRRRAPARGRWDGLLPVPWLLPVLLLAFLCPTAPAAPAPVAASSAKEPLPGYLRWNRAQRRVDADLQGWPLTRALERIASATGWHVFMEPGLDLRVAARFENRPEREALAALLADVNFALLPSRTTNGPARLLVFRSSTTHATVAVPPAADAAQDKAKALGKELVVRLKHASRNAIEALARKLGARVAGALDSLGAYRLVFDSEEAANAARASLAENEEVASVESNYAVAPPGQIERVPGVDVPGVNLKARPMNDTSSVIVALLDTGIPAGSTAHSDFLLPSVSVASTTTSASGGLTHGPAMFETILQGLELGQQGANGQPVRVLPIDIYGGQEETSTFELAQGIVAALDRGADVLNLSLSGPSPSPLVQDVLAQAAQAGVLAFAAPGNTPSVEPTYPASYPEVVAVTASDRRGQLADYANRGAFVDLMAPGTSVVPYAGDAWVVNGTSVSTAYTAGLAAGLLADSGRPASEVLQQLKARLGFQPPTTTTPAPAPVTKP